MRGPTEIIGDLYDYNFQYYRWFLHRRLLFSELKAEDVKQAITYNIFSENDHNNVGKLLQQTTLTGFSAGLGLGSVKYSLDVAARGVKASKAFPKAFACLLVGTAVGIAYGSSVNLIANYRGQKSDYANHVLASIISLPLTGAFAKANKLQWGMTNAVIGAMIFGYMKTTYGGRFVQINAPKPEEKIRAGIFSTQYQPK